MFYLMPHGGEPKTLYTLAGVFLFYWLTMCSPPQDG